MQLMPTVFMLTRKETRPLNSHSTEMASVILKKTLQFGKLCLLAVVQALTSHQYHLCYLRNHKNVTCGISALHTSLDGAPDKLQDMLPLSIEHELSVWH